MWALPILIIGIAQSATGQTCMEGGLYSPEFNECYSFVYSPQNYQEAQYVCNALGGSLVTIANRFQQTFVSEHARVAFVHTDYWIGLNDINEVGVWEWEDASTSSFVNWQKGLPFANDSLNCVVARLHDGKWYNTNCLGVKNNIVCQTDPQVTSPIENGKACAGSGMMGVHADNCLYFFNSKQNFHDAELTCGSIHGEIVSLSNSTIQKFVADEARQKINRDDYWIGLNDIYQTGDWQWSDPVDFMYSNWAPGNPVDDKKKCCAAVKLMTGKWYNDICEKENFFICETPIVSVVKPVTTVDPHFYDGWTYFIVTNAWYKLFENGTWDQYENICVSNGGHLSSIHSLAENEFVASLGITSKESIGIGFKSKSGVKGTFSWTDNSRIDYDNWMAGNPIRNYSCVFIKKPYTMKWGNYPCDFVANYNSGVCKKFVIPQKH